MFCRSDDKEQIDIYLQSNPISGLAQVISLNQARKLYRSFQDRKKLLSCHSHFVCDERIYSHLCNLLGKTFGNRNNFPLPIRYTTIAKLSTALSKALSSTYMHLRGKSVSIRMGHTGLATHQIIDNVTEGLQNAIPKFPQHGKSILSIHLKLSDSPALPVYSREKSDTLEYVKTKAVEKTATAAPDNINDIAPSTKTVKKIILADSTSNTDPEKNSKVVKRKAPHMSMPASIIKPDFAAVNKKIKLDTKNSVAASAAVIAPRGKVSKEDFTVSKRPKASQLPSEGAVASSAAAATATTDKLSNKPAGINGLYQSLTKKKLTKLRAK